MIRLLSLALAAMGGAVAAVTGLALMYRASVVHRVGGNAVPFTAKGWRGMR